MNPPVLHDRTSASFDGEDIKFDSLTALRHALSRLWEGLPPPPQSVGVFSVQSPLGPSLQLRERPDPQPAWLIGFRKAFLKAVDSIDRNLQGRVLQALHDIAIAPVTNRGDTVKPLTGDLDGYWRYRIGDFRLVYYPDARTRTVTLYDFAGRGGVYE